ncbi:MAG: hypothetical protein PWQ91_1053 [Eubacteriales bacterium]|nr:hypothetical protein [Eubacteriales bacterium]
MFLPITREEMEQRDWYYVDFALITGDAYVDHPSFGAAVIARVLEAEGFRVGIIPQPNWRRDEDFTRLGRPRYAFLVTAGNLDSMVSNYTSWKKKRKEDAYSPGGKPGRRPDRATIVYTRRLKELYPEVPVIIGGLEASLRRFAHYDYWSDSVRPSILVESGADLLVYGMGELQIKEIAARLKKKRPLSELRDIAGTAFVLPLAEALRLAEEKKGEARSPLLIPSYEEVKASKEKYAEAFRIQYEEQNPFTGRPLIQPHGEMAVWQNPPARPLTTEELDRVYELPYERYYHPAYEKEGGVPAIEEVEFSLVSVRGCFGGCAFCALYMHQGPIVQYRSKESLLREARQLIASPRFKGYIHDVGGPTANFRRPACRAMTLRGQCRKRLCLFPRPCPNLEVSHREYLEILRELRRLPGVKKVFVRSGLRYDYIMADPEDEFLWELCRHHVSGQLKVAPEHADPGVLKVMRKPGPEVFRDFVHKFREINRKLGMEQYLVPYFISAHPGAGLKEAVRLAEFIRDMKFSPEQVQDFIPTPGTVATCIYYTGIDPFTGEKVYVPRSEEERRMQRALLQYKNPRNWPLVRKALRLAGREDLIGYGPRALVPPEGEKKRRR